MRPVGRLKRDGGRFVVTCEPHVMLRLKRVFGQLEKSSHSEAVLTDTAETAHELLWFMDRYPLEADAATQGHLFERRREYLDRRTVIETALALDYEPRRFELAIPARHYQELATNLFLRTGALRVADDVGIGKTLVAIAALTDPSTRPALIVTITHLPGQWTREIDRFLPGLIIHRLKSARAYPLPPVDVIITNYHKLSGWAEVLGGHIKMVVFDEVQELRTGPGDHGRILKYHAAKHIADLAEYRLGLSATPIYNYGDEMFNILNVLSPDRLGTQEEFSREWCYGGYGVRGARIADPRAFGKYLREEGLMLRRTRRDVGRELPEVSRVPQYVDADLEAIERVETTAAELARIILDANPLARGEKFRAAEELSYLLRQATGIAKAPYVAAFVRLLVESGEKVVLYGWHHEVYKLWGEQLKHFGPVFYTGRESVPQKERALEAFLNGETPIIILSLRAGAGLDGLQQVSRTVVFGELDWSPGVHEQCVGRVHRDGQQEPVMAYFLVSDVGSDPIVADVLGLKTEQSEAIRDPDAEIIETLQVDPQHVRRLAEEYLRQRGLRVDRPRPQAAAEQEALIG